MAQYLVSIIIPVLNEAVLIQETLERLNKYSQIEVIVVDGGSHDATVALAQSQAKVVKVIGKGRGRQMNVGAALAQSDTLLFLHADTQLPHNFIELINSTVADAQVAAGAFELAIDGTGIALRAVEMLVWVRSHWFGLPYGDQGIFISKSNFQTIGGFRELPIMEDFEFVQRAKRLGRIAIAPAAVVTSSRRWQKLGVWQTTLVNQLMIMGYYLGISPTKLSKLYRNWGRAG